MIKLQVTFFQKENKYKPISTIVEIDSLEYYENNKAEVQKRALLNIAHNRRTTPNNLIQQGYTKIKTREYNIEEIKKQQEFKHRVNLLKYIDKKRKE